MSNSDHFLEFFKQKPGYTFGWKKIIAPLWPKAYPQRFPNAQVYNAWWHSLEDIYSLGQRACVQIGVINKDQLISRQKTTMTLCNTSSYQRANDYHRARIVQRVLQRATQTTTNMLIHKHTGQDKHIHNHHGKGGGRHIPCTKDEGSNDTVSNTVMLAGLNMLFPHSRPLLRTKSFVSLSHSCSMYLEHLHHLHKHIGHRL